MKKIAKWLAVFSFVLFVVDWGIIGLKLLDKNYLIRTEAYIGLIALVVFSACILYVKLTNCCPHCGKTSQSFGKYCPHCGKEMN